MKKSLLTASLLLSLTIYGQSWNLTGNSATNPGTNFLGTSDNKDFIIKTNNTERVRINSDGKIAVGGAVDPEINLKVHGRSQIVSNADSDVFFVGNDSDNVGNGNDLIFLRYGKYQPNNPSVMTVSGLTEPSKYEVLFNIRANGNIGVGIHNPQYKLDVLGKSSFSDNMKVGGKVEAKEVKVTATPTADFVFEEDYQLPKLEEIEKHIREKKHLPEVASAKEMENEGVNIGEFQIKLLQKIEELTLYSIEQNKQLKFQEEQLRHLQEENKTLKSQSEDIKELKKQVQQLLSTKK
ncbi:hypothetical protein MP477_18790 [Chryseobacterium sp. WG23]|uniref:hypothetical protein n=1 Tax=Chryseobacterium sp. WG23 TaxID=2926910 RepID=UPI00211DC26A|nr:hypothetical protein [Chryseobacterium sp. WG23]MCQ9636996.1 hypothetical protein [Chryseobacterium sp. WG23]